MVGRLKYLIDTNIWLELLLEQEKEEEVRSFFERVSVENIAITDFSVYSVGIILTRLDKDDIFKKFTRDVFSDSQVPILSVSSEHYEELIDNRLSHTLDFDDAYQFTVCQKYDLSLVSFDADFDNIPNGRHTPAEVLSNL
jgi:hypothetical protein